MRTHPLRGRVILLLVVFTTAGFLVARELAGQSRSTVQAPYFEVDPFWPKPLPNHWVLGSSIGVSVDERDHVWMIHRGSATLAEKERALETKLSDECCAGGAAGARVRSPAARSSATGAVPAQGYEWPTSNHGITIDHKGNVWIGGNGPGDSQVLKFSRAGKFLLQVGKADARMGAMKDGKPTYAGGSNDPISFGRVAKIFVDPVRERGVSRRRLLEQARRDRRCRYREAETLLGRLRQQARRHRSRSV